MSNTLIDLVTDNGEIIRIEVPPKFTDDALETIENAMKRKDWWSVRQWDGAKAVYMGLTIDRVNMTRVVAML